MQHVLNPSKVSVAFWWRTVLPAHVFRQRLTPPIFDIERRVGHDKVSA